MAIIEGGLHGSPSGSVGEITYSEARGRDGKVTTARQKSDPANPNTEAQQAQRTKFNEAVDITKRHTPAIYRSDWNRAVGDLPGFQSMVSVMTDNLAADYTLSAPSPVNLGSLDALANVNMTADPTADEVTISFDSDQGDIGTSNDSVVASAVRAGSAENQERPIELSIGSASRSSGSVSLSVPVNTGDTYVGMIYARGADSAEGLLSTVNFPTVTA
jgi:hypothetical protein